MNNHNQATTGVRRGCWLQRFVRCHGRIIQKSRDVLGRLVERVMGAEALDSLDSCETGRTSSPYRATHSPEPSAGFCKSRKNTPALWDAYTSPASQQKHNHQEQPKMDWEIYDAIKDHWLTQVTTWLLNIGALLLLGVYLLARLLPPLKISLCMLLLLPVLIVCQALFETNRKMRAYKKLTRMTPNKKCNNNSYSQ